MLQPSGSVYNVLGDTVNLAARLRPAAGANTVPICPRTWEMVTSWFETVPTDRSSLLVVPQVEAFRRISSGQYGGKEAKIACRKAWVVADSLTDLTQGESATGVCDLPNPMPAGRQEDS